MYVEINLLSASILVLVFAVLLLISHSRRSQPVPADSRMFKRERRDHPRYKTSIRIRYKTPLEEGISWIKDISRSGARIFLNNTLKTLGIGEQLAIEIDLPFTSNPIQVKGSIVWSRDEDAGFRFVEPGQGDIEKIIEFVSGDPKAAI